MGALLGLAAALAFGVSDYVGGVAARRMHFLHVTLIGQSVGMLTTWVCLLAFHGRGPTTPALLWGACSGLGSAAGTLALYRGYGRGEMAVTGPLSAVGAAVIPATVGISLGDDLPLLGLAGVVLAVPAIWLMATTRGSSRARGAKRMRVGVLDGLLSGAGFGILFIALGLAGDDAGLWPLAAGQTTAWAALLIAAAVTRRPWPPLSGGPGRLAVAAGALGITATVLYFSAAHTSLLTVAAVLTSLYPGVTVALAAILLRERPTAVQLTGLALGAVAVTAIVLA
jgi:drug/metabolite transporter (DMT)-like permease